MQKKLPKLSPGAAKVAGVSMVTLIAVGAIVLIAHQATSSVTAAPAAKPVVMPAPSAAPAARATAVKGKPANAPGTEQVQKAVTITGCLEEDHDAFTLKSTSGDDAPKSRSWKTLGLTKRSSAVTIADPANRLKLRNHVGERVSVTGALEDKELQGRTLHRVAMTCD